MTVPAVSDSADPDLTQFHFVGESPAFRAAARVLKRMAGCAVPVLLRGETGTGKELAARVIHYQSARRELPFIPINCGAIPDLLVESELFGHMRGAFTDARDTQIGLIAQANDGTLFLDEVDSLSMKAQIALLRFLQDGTFRPLGAKTTSSSRARIIAATNADIETLVRGGTFRSDLFFRLSIVPVFLPPLRERLGDVRLLVDTFLRALADQHCTAPRCFDEDSLCRLEGYSWPGNVRELANVVQRVFLLSDSDCLGLPIDAFGAPGDVTKETSGNAVAMATSFNQARAQALADFECRFVSAALSASAGNVSLAASRSGKERRSFGRLLKKHGIDRAAFSSKH